MGSIRDNANFLGGKEEKKIQFCVYCGGKLDEGARFCKHCGAPVITIPDAQPQDDEISMEKRAVEAIPTGAAVNELTPSQKLAKKLEIINSSVTAVEPDIPKKGVAKFIGQKQAKSKQEQAEGLKEENTITTIGHFIIPCTEEDITEFLSLASDNVKPKVSGKYDIITRVWLVKAMQLCQRAEVKLSDQEYKNINDQMEQLKKTLKRKGRKGV